MSDSFVVENFAADGILGLGFPSLSFANVTPVFHSLIEQQTNLPAPLFTFDLTPAGSQLTLGPCLSRFRSSSGELTTSRSC
jgi:hypothetical protein